ncbi:hypothetical protein R3P38DRAFT_3544987 [Favolaschia claudopus]|uniref:Uncharacterized protein n=1 Tax=Favolaschia claudopus TaxID=2862362 RepID=A0AAW0DYP8_9AGAR
MPPGHHLKTMAVLRRAQSSTSGAGNSPASSTSDPVDASDSLDSEDTVTTFDYDSIPSTTINLRASQVTVQPSSTASTGHSIPRVRMSDREFVFIIIVVLFGMAALLLAVVAAHLLWRRCCGRRETSQAISKPQDHDGDRSGSIEEYSAREHKTGFPLLEYQLNPPSPLSLHPAPSMLDMNFSLPYLADTESNIRTPSMELTAVLEQFERRLLQEETDIALALDIAFGHESHHHAPFFLGSKEDVTTMLSLQAGLESVGKRAGAIRNRTRQGSDASASSQSTTVTIEGFTSHSSSDSSLTSMASTTLSYIEESSEEVEEEIYEVKRAQTHSMEIQRGKLISWAPAGLRLMVTGPSSATLETSASSSVSVDLDEFPLPP